MAAGAGGPSWNLALYPYPARWIGVAGEWEGPEAKMWAGPARAGPLDRDLDLDLDHGCLRVVIELLNFFKCADIRYAN